MDGDDRWRRQHTEGKCQRAHEESESEREKGDWLNLAGGIIKYNRMASDVACACAGLGAGPRSGPCFIHQTPIGNGDDEVPCPIGAWSRSTWIVTWRRDWSIGSASGAGSLVKGCVFVVEVAPT